MESSRRRNNKNNFEIANLDKKVDQFFIAIKIWCGLTGLIK